jgi:hypothetical protein
MWWRQPKPLSLFSLNLTHTGKIMAFNTAPATGNTNGIPDNKKAEGFLNFYLPNKAGDGRRKLGAIPLRKMYQSEAELAKWLAEDPSRVAIILARLVIEYNPATPEEAAGFDLSDPVPATPAPAPVPPATPPAPAGKSKP